MIRTFVRNSTVYMAANAITKLIGLAFFGYIARVLTVQEMGAYSLLNVYLSVLTLFMTLQIHDGFTRYYWDIPAEQRRRFEISTINLLLLGNAMLAALLFPLRPLVSALVVPLSPALYVVLLALPVTTAIMALYGSKLRLENRALHAGAQMVLQVAVYVGATWTLLKVGWPSLLAVFSGFLAQSMFAGLCYFLELRTWQFRIDFGLIRRSLVFSALIVPAALGGYCSLLAGRYIVGRLLDVESVGIYEVCNKVAQTLQLIMGPLLQATGPIVYARYREAGFAPHYFRLLRLHMAATLILVIGISLLAREAVHVIGGSRYVPHSGYVLAFAMTAVLLHMTSFFVNNVHLSQRVQYITVIEIVAGILSTLATFALVRAYGFRGALAAAVLAYGLRCLLYLVFANGLYASLRISYRLMGGYLIGVGVLLAVHFGLRDLALPWRVLLAVGETSAVMGGLLRLERVGLRQLLTLVRPA